MVGLVFLGCGLFLDFLGFFWGVLFFWDFFLVFVLFCFCFFGVYLWGVLLGFSGLFFVWLVFLFVGCWGGLGWFFWGCVAFFLFGVFFYAKG